MTAQPNQRSSLLQRTLGVFVVLAIFLAGFLWAGKTLIERPVEGVYLDARRLAALRTFERAIVPLRSLRDYREPTADQIRGQFSFCADPLKAQAGEAVSARSRRLNPCAGNGAAEELACHLRTINSKLNEMSSDQRKDRERVLGERYVVDVDRWAESIREKQQAVACRDVVAAARQLAARDGRLLGLLAWREFSSKSVIASQFAPGQALKVPGRILEQRNPWGGGARLHLLRRRGRARPAPVRHRPAPEQPPGLRFDASERDR